MDNPKTPDQLMAEYCFTSSSSASSATENRLDIAPQEILDFGSWATSKISTYREFTIQNSGFDDIGITRVELMGPFFFFEPVPSIIYAGQTYTGRLYYQPTAVGPQEGIFVIDAEEASGDHSLKLLGTGLDYSDPDIKAIVDEGSVTPDTFPYWEDQLDVIVNIELPNALV